jgi:DNA-binding PadR family transcriptional regulator
MDLTHRQEYFIRKLLDLYRDMDEPLHYAHLADHLGVSKDTAYYMLNLLKRKGYIESIYERRAEGPGRATVLFRPSIKAHETFERLSEGSDANWDEIKEQIVTKVSRGEFEDMNLAVKILAHVKTGKRSDIDYCFVILGSIAANMGSRARVRILRRYYPVVEKVAATTGFDFLRSLPFFMLGMSAMDSDSPDRIDNLVDYLQRYERNFDAMDKESRQTLLVMVKKVLFPKGSDGDTHSDSVKKDGASQT